MSEKNITSKATLGLKARPFKVNQIQNDMKNLMACLFLGLIISASAQKREIEVGNFTKVSFGVPGVIYITQGSSNSLVIDASDEAMDLIEIEEDGSRLRIKQKNYRNWKMWRDNDITVYVTMRNVSDLSVSGSGDMIGKNKIKTGDLGISVSGSGNVELDVASDDLDISISGSGDVSLEGTGNEAETSISGSGKLMAEDLEVDVFEASISGSGKCYITANKEIDARISGSGTVYYKGNPDRVSSRSSGSGKVKKM